MAGVGHVPVLVDAVVALLQPSRGGVFVDCTVGLGGHAAALLQAGATRVVGIDRDAEALATARARLGEWGERVSLVHADFREIARVLASLEVAPVVGVLADLGVSSMQFDAPGRGFSFRVDESLDMRMDRTTGIDAATWLADRSEQELADALTRFGEERFARRIARALVNARQAGPIRTTGQLASIVRRAVPRGGRQRIDPATRTFQAVRIAVNAELEGLDRFAADAVSHLVPGGRLGVISFHSLEDRVVKHTFRAMAAEGGIRLVTKKPVTPEDAEIARNPRARSAKFRVAERAA
ncbi:MAG: 16S rRNA (cytosine(1402)-N(4))-methyltransferase RsmH [Vicinamibacterales bacterium]